MIGFERNVVPTVPLPEFGLGFLMITDEDELINVQKPTKQLSNRQEELQAKIRHNI